MTSWYYNPPAPWELVADADASSGCYEFDMVAAFRNTDTGAVIAGQDSGCSCYSPYEGWSEADFVQVRTIGDLDGPLSELSEYRPLSAADRLDFINKVRAAL